MMGCEQSRYLSFVEVAATLLLLIYPIAMLAVKGGMNGVFLLMLFLAMAVSMVRPIGINAVVWSREVTIYAVSMFAMSAAILMSQTYHQNLLRIRMMQHHVTGWLSLSSCCCNAFVSKFLSGCSSVSRWRPSPAF